MTAASKYYRHRNCYYGGTFSALNSSDLGWGRCSLGRNEYKHQRSATGYGSKHLYTD